MSRWALLVLAALLGAVVMTAPSAADPPTNPDVGKWTDSQKLDDILEKLRKLDSLRSELRMLESSIKELLGLSDKLKLIEDKVKKLDSDLNLLLSQVPNNQQALQEQIRKLQQEVEALKANGKPLPETRLKPPTTDPDLERRLQNIEGGLAQIGGFLAEMRRTTPLPLPTVVTAKDGRIVRVVNRAPFAVTVLFDDLPFRVEANAEGQFSPEQDLFTYEVQNSNQARRTITLERNGRITLTLNWP